MALFAKPSPDNHFLADHIALLNSSYQQLTGKTWLDWGLKGPDYAQAIFNAPFVVLSHDPSAEPIFTYANLTAQKLFEMDWAEFTSLPSRRSAEQPNQEERARLLDAVTKRGFIDNYQGIRISKTGRKFWILDATVWNLIDPEGNYHGQAAICPRWQYV
ncbi:MAG: MEKHLA domain-containing protein [Microcystaceae cyanobacterium]